jgi:hypothetical protein
MTFTPPLDTNEVADGLVRSVGKRFFPLFLSSFFPFPLLLTLFLSSSHHLLSGLVEETNGREGRSERRRPDMFDCWFVPPNRGEEFGPEERDSFRRRGWLGVQQ